MGGSTLIDWEGIVWSILAGIIAGVLTYGAILLGLNRHLRYDPPGSIKRRGIQAVAVAVAMVVAIVVGAIVWRLTN